IINHGRLIANKPTRELVDMAQEKIVIVTVDRTIDIQPEHGCFDKVEQSADRVLRITYSKERANAGQVLSAVRDMGFEIVDVATREPDLEDVFLNLTAAA
ncbi:MAG: ABC transporter ATP-binding protein, partial [Sphingobium sp.]|nr:ABC transporter ATP-binding protein [Sphingobium sp.]